MRFYEPTPWSDATAMATILSPAACWNTGILLIIALNCPFVVNFAQLRPTLQHSSSSRQTLRNIVPSFQCGDAPINF
jgi:hypothetical protein